MLTKANRKSSLLSVAVCSQTVVVNILGRSGWM
jgi:hypothetical protein